MDYRGIFVIILILLLIFVLLILFLANRKPEKIRVPRPDPPTNLHAQQVPGGYTLTWNSAKGASAYNLYLFENPYNIKGATVKSVQNIQNPYFLKHQDDVNFIGLTSVTNYQNGELESELCKFYELPPLLPQPLQETSLPPPILNCQGAFNFDGQFEAIAETCFQQAADDKIVLRWYPVQGAASYNLYYNKGALVTPNAYQQKVSLGSTAYQYVSPPLNPGDCWSFIVTAVDQEGRETESSQLFTTCNP